MTLQMSEKKVNVKHDGSRVKVKYTDYENLIEKIKTKFKISTDFDLEYQDVDEEWTKICDDEDLNDISSKTVLRLLLKETEGSLSGEGNNTAIGGAASYEGNAQNVGGNVSGNVVGKDCYQSTTILKYKTENNPTIVLQQKESTSNRTNSKEACESFKKKLLDSIKGQAVISSPIYDCKVSIVKLQITSMEQEIQKIKEGTHLHHREERTLLMNKKIHGDVEIDKLFEKATELAENQSATKTLPNKPNALEEHIEKQGNYVVISGQPGSGKTTLSKTILAQVIGKERLFDIDFVFYLVFRDVDYGKKVGVLKFLAPSISCDTNQIRSVLHELETSKKVLIIMDGLDESGIDFTVSHPSVSIDDEATPEIFIKNLLKKSILPNAKKLILSRPRTIAELPYDYKPSLVATILGLNKIAQKQICNDICKENTEKVYQYLENNADLSAYCQTPLNLILVAHTLNETVPNNSTNIPRSITDVLIFVLRLLCDKEYNKNHLRGNFDAKSTASLAWNGFKDDKFSFSQKDFDKGFNTDDLFITINSKTKLPLLGGNPKTAVFFSHLVLQEFFTALHLLYFMEFKEFKETFFSSNKSVFTQTKFELVTKFMFGLCNKKSSENVKQIISSDVFPRKKLDLLCSSVEFELYHEIDDNLLRYFLWAYELNDDNFTQKLANCLSDEIDLSCRMLPSDFSAFHYVCGTTKQQSITFQSLSNENFYGECWDQFLSDKKLYQYLNKKQKVEFIENQISDEAAQVLARCSDKIQSLALQGVTVTTIGLITVFSGVAKLDKKMENLKIRWNQIKDEVSHVLSKCSNKVQSLTLQEVNMTTIGWISVFSGVAALDEKMEKMELIDNQISDEAAHAMGKCSDKIQSLSCQGVTMTTIGWTSVFSGVANLDEKMQKVELIKNQISDEAAHGLARCSGKIQSLTLQDVTMTTIGWTSVFNGVAKLDEKMHKMELSENQISDEAAHALSICSDKIQSLTLYYCTLTTIGWTSVFSGVANLDEKMGNMQIKWNEIGDEAAHALGKCSDKIQSLTLQGVTMTTIGWTSVFSGVAKLNEKMEKMELIDNQISDEPANALGKCSDKIQSLLCQGVTMTTIGWTSVFSGVAKLDEKMGKMKLQLNEISDEAAHALGKCSDKIQSLTLQEVTMTTIGWTSVFSGVAKSGVKMNELIIEYKQNDISDELIEEYKTRLQSNVTNLTLKVKK